MRTALGSAAGLIAVVDMKSGFILDKVRFDSAVHDLAVGRSVEETLRVLKAFQQVEKTGEVCPAGWTEGAKTMKADPVKSKEYFASAAR